MLFIDMIRLYLYHYVCIKEKKKIICSRISVCAWFGPIFEISLGCRPTTRKSSWEINCSNGDEEHDEARKEWSKLVGRGVSFGLGYKSQHSLK